ncbi:MAG: DUF3455 domain-containing protein [Casimicrobiaceae bacterium]
MRCIVEGVAVVLIAGCSVMPGAFTRTAVPSELTPAANQKLDRVVVATGLQIYRCDPKKDQPGQFEWVFQAPEAVLRDVAGKYLGKHYAGPTWEANDGSKVVGTVQARRDVANAKSIPWLRLSTRSIGSAGEFAGVTTILRIGTSGGVAAASGCNDAERGKIVRVPYEADYNFYVTR